MVATSPMGATKFLFRRDAEPEPPEPTRFARSRNRNKSRRNVLLGAGVKVEPSKIERLGLRKGM